ncbi:protein Jade-1-like [Zingiber officinale]|uniref:Protein Jade-1 n=1 Tax=Zingiber officinale TaxID=94328 RepID=A0A8J5LKY2_ZINOF|nr:protein Jade-1-like [Zingiber officinale]KAG6521113.1 hypothetical protein ZIOFF_018179 [Zingiber officinale]
MELPPSKRYKLLHQQEDLSHGPYFLESLPAKKRLSCFTAAVCLPAKKRVWAPFHASSIDLNLRPGDEAEEEEGPKEPASCGEEADEEDDGVICAVCRSTDGDPLDPIVFCDGCDLMVHASCYGSPLIDSIPEGDWFCTLCERRPEKGAAETSCCLCPVQGGAMKLTEDGRWAHIVCALFVPEVFFRDPKGREGVDCSRVPDRRWKQICYLCGAAGGCAVECSEPKCRLSFHVSCGLEQRLCFEYKEWRGAAIVAGFCAEHTKLWVKQQQSGKFRIVAREEQEDRKGKGKA